MRAAIMPPMKIVLQKFSQIFSRSSGMSLVLSKATYSPS
jgi:hypothetical protein